MKSKKKPHIILTDQQKAANEMVELNKLVIVSGKPGSGKTTVIKHTVKWADSKKMRVLLCAPTGKAAKRMMEATEYPATTVHSMLECEFDGHTFQFIHNEDNQLDCDLLVIDEASMISADLFYDLLKAVDISRTKLLLIGDPGQLPSVGYGAVLRDLLKTKIVPHVELNVIHRNSGKIVEACASIHAGKVYEPAKALDLDAENPINLIHLEISSPDKILEAIEGLACDRMPLRNYNSIWDVQVISPTNTRGQLSCEMVNKVLQKRLNPNLAQIIDTNDKRTSKFYENDKVIQTKNEKFIGTDGRPTMVVNGDIGKIVEIPFALKDDMIVEFYDPLRKVKIPQKDNNLLLAYCITCHRMQGSEAPVVIIPVHTSFSFFTTRNWLYTAISRAKEICITVGQFTAIRQMIANINNNERYTKLSERILNHYQQSQSQRSMA